LQRVDNYEYELPSDFEDEEIDDEEAFNSEDERMYGHLFKKDKGGGDASEEEEEEDEEEEEESDEDDLLNSEDDGEEEASEDEEEDSELEDVFAKAGAAGGGESPTFFGSDEEAEEEDEDDEDDYAVKEAAREAMVRAVTDGAVSGEGRNIRGRRRKEIVVTEAYPESEFNLPAAG
jgi:U3 small nucleolar RNA-associated protein 14